MGVYDQFIWFGDSLTQRAWCQEAGFAAGAALQDGEIVLLLRVCFRCFFITLSLYSSRICLSHSDGKHSILRILLLFGHLSFLEESK